MLSRFGYAFLDAPAGAGDAVRIGIAGASGFAGQELLRLLAGHPRVRVTSAMSTFVNACYVLCRFRVWQNGIVSSPAARIGRAISLRQW